MRVFISFENAVHSLDVDIDATVGDIKHSLRKRFRLNLASSQNKGETFESLSYQDSILQDGWTYSILGIPSGSALVYCVRKPDEPTLKVYCTNYHETVVIKHSFVLWDALLDTVRRLIQESFGLHVSTFRLYSASGLELLDCYSLKMYGINVGDTVTMEIWRDVADLIRALRENDITCTLETLSTCHDKPQLLLYLLQLGLFTAAHYGYHQLANHLMKRGARPDEPVGFHPSRDWCKEPLRGEFVKTPVHEAAQYGHIKCLQLFVLFNYTVLICEDAQGLTPANIARRYKHTECFKLLVAEQFRVLTLHREFSLRVFLRLRKWCDRARLRARFYSKDRKASLLLANPLSARKHVVAGENVEINGYREDRNNSVRSNTSKKDNSPCGNSNTRSKSIPSSFRPGSTHRIHADDKLQSASTKEDDYLTSKSNSRGVTIEYQGGIQRQKAISARIPSTVASLESGKSKRRCKFIDSSMKHHGALNNSLSFRSLRADKSRKKYVFMATTPLPAAGEGTNIRYVWKPSTLFENVFQDGETEDLECRGPKKDDERRRSVGRSLVPGAEPCSGSGSLENDGKCRSRNQAVIPRSPRETGAEYSRSRAQSPAAGGNVGFPKMSWGKRACADRKTVFREKTLVDDMDGRQTCESFNMRWSSKSTTRVHHDLSDFASAEYCLELACQIYRRKNWLGKFQMALAMNSNMCKRRHSGRAGSPSLPRPMSWRSSRR